MTLYVIDHLIRIGVLMLLKVQARFGAQVFTTTRSASWELALNVNQRCVPARLAVPASRNGHRSLCPLVFHVPFTTLQIPSSKRILSQSNIPRTQRMKLVTMFQLRRHEPSKRRSSLHVRSSANIFKNTYATIFPIDMQRCLMPSSSMQWLML